MVDVIVRDYECSDGWFLPVHTGPDCNFLTLAREVSKGAESVEQLRIHCRRIRRKRRVPQFLMPLTARVALHWAQYGEFI